MDPTFKKKFSETNFFCLHYNKKNTLNPLLKSVFKSVHNHRRYLHFCDRQVCSIQYAATRRPQLRARPILCTGLRPVQIFLVNLLLFPLGHFCIYLTALSVINDDDNNDDNDYQQFIWCLLRSVLSFFVPRVAMYSTVSPYVLQRHRGELCHFEVEKKEADSRDFQLQQLQHARRRKWSYRVQYKTMTRRQTSIFKTFRKFTLLYLLILFQRKLSEL